MSGAARLADRGRPRRAAALGAAALIPAVAVLGNAAADGGYFPTSWGWTAVGLSLVAAVGIGGRRSVALEPLGPLSLGALAALALWIGASLVWSDSVPLSALELQRALMYVAALTALLVLVHDRATALAAGTGVVAVANVVAGWNLSARTWPHIFEASTAGHPGDFAEPLGYANAVGILCALGFLLALGLGNVVRSKAARIAAVAAGILPAMAALASESRGALLALVFGGLAGAAIRTRRSGRVFGSLVVLALVAVLAVARAESVQRAAYWRVAAEAAREHPLLGTGAGTWERVWLRQRTEQFTARDAHSLPLEALAELGPIGLVLFILALSAPLAAAGRCRGDPLFAALAGPYVAFLLHAAADWDWEVPAVTLMGLTCGAALFAVAPGRRLELTPAAKGTALTLIGLLALTATATLAGNAATSASADALRAAEWRRAERLATTASRLAFWASEPWRLRGEAQRAQGERAQARASFRHGLRKDPADPELWVALARVSNGTGRRDAQERARQLNPLGVARPEAR